MFNFIWSFSTLAKRREVMRWNEEREKNNQREANVFSYTLFYSAQQHTAGQPVTLGTLASTSVSENSWASKVRSTL